MKKRIKICFVVAVDITIKLILLNCLKRLQKENYQVWVVCSEGNFVKDIEKLGIKVKTIKISRRIKPFEDVVAIYKLYLFLRGGKFDIVQVQTPKAAFLGQIAAMLARVPIIINNNFGFYFENFEPVKKWFFVFFEKMAAKRTDVMFTINKEDIQTAIQEKIFKPEKIAYLGFGIDVARFDPQKYSLEFVANKKKELNIGPKKKVVGIIARLVKEKGYVELFEAFGKVLEKLPDVVLLIVGIEEPEKKDGFTIDTIKKYGIEKNVVFLGERKDIEELYLVMDVYVLPSHREGLGNTILEASSMGLPVVASDIRGCRESVAHGKTGVLVPVKNPQKLAEAIQYLFENPHIALAMGKAGREKIIREFSEEMVFLRMKSQYDVLIEKKLS